MLVFFICATSSITTPEKWDSITRRWVDNIAIMGQFAVVLIDEVHTVGEERGAALEAVGSITTEFDYTVCMLRFLIRGVLMCRW